MSPPGAVWTATEVVLLRDMGMIPQPVSYVVQYSTPALTRIVEQMRAILEQREALDERLAVLDEELKQLALAEVVP